LASFEYDPGRRFRSYLSVIVNSAISDHMNKRRRPTFIAGEDLTQLLASLPAREDLVARIEAAYDKELLQVAMQQVEKRVHAHTWRAFYLLALEGRSGVEVAVELGMEVNTAYVARKKVQRMIREVITKLETGGEEATL
jgi:RNA polymerase sigma-70 factor (ECF subfamily)